MGNSKTHKKNNCLFQIKVLNADNYFMENLAPSRNLHFCHPDSYCHQSVTLWQKCGQSHSLNSIQNIPEVLTVFQFCQPSIVIINFGKSTTIFIQTFIKTLIILRVNKHFGENFACQFYLTTVFCSA